MKDDILKSEGPYKFEKTGKDEYLLNAPVPTGDDGHFARACPDSDCSPGYFRLKEGTGLTGYDCAQTFCPYCRREEEPNEFITKEQLDYLESIVARRATEGLKEMIFDTLGIRPGSPKKMGGDFLSIEMSVKPSSLPSVRIPREEELRREVICPSCKLEHHVFGLATWCPDCGQDIFLAHLAGELEVLKRTLLDVERRRVELGPRYAARDLENTLEDLVSVFEAVLKILTRRKLAESTDIAEVDKKLKRIGNAFQSISRGRSALQDLLGLDLFGSDQGDDAEFLARMFEKRHPITHNLGVVDRKYIERAATGESEGREVMVTENELRSSIRLSWLILSDLYAKSFPGSIRPSVEF